MLLRKFHYSGCNNSFVPGDGLGEGFGMLGQAGSGKLRISAAQSKLKPKATKKYTFSFFIFFLFMVPVN